MISCSDLTNNIGGTLPNSSNLGRKKPAPKRTPLRPAIMPFLLVSLFAIVAVRNLNPGSYRDIGGPFQLVTHDGRAVSDKDFLGRPLLVMFGDTNCRDICPLMVLSVSEALKELGHDVQLSAAFITVDPERDTPEALQNFLAPFELSPRRSHG